MSLPKSKMRINRQPKANLFVGLTIYLVVAAVLLAVSHRRATEVLTYVHFARKLGTACQIAAMWRSPQTQLHHTDMVRAQLRNGLEVEVMFHRLQWINHKWWLMRNSKVFGTTSFTSNNDDTRHCASGCSTASSDDMVHALHSTRTVDDRNIGKASSSVEATSGKEFENLICIEIFSGSGRLTAAIRKVGIRAVAFDRTSNRTCGPVTILDLVKDEDFNFLMNYIKSEKENILLIHLAPPCGTCSAARNKRHRTLEAAGYDLPVPLRSKEWPMGLPPSRGLDAAKVAGANALYERIFQIASLDIDLQLTVSIENPESSLFWDTDPIIRLMEKCYGITTFQSCMMGGDRDKRTKRWCSDDTFFFFQCYVRWSSYTQGVDTGGYIRRFALPDSRRSLLSVVAVWANSTFDEGDFFGICSGATTSIINITAC